MGQKFPNRKTILLTSNLNLNVSKTCVHQFVISLHRVCEYLSFHVLTILEANNTCISPWFQKSQAAVEPVQISKLTAYICQTGPGYYQAPVNWVPTCILLPSVNRYSLFHQSAVIVKPNNILVIACAAVKFCSVFIIGKITC